MDQQNSVYLQLALFGLAFAGLQVWWISSILGQRRLASPMAQDMVRRSLERIWTKRS